MILYLDTSALVKLYAEEPGRREVEDSVRPARGGRLRDRPRRGPLRPGPRGARGVLLLRRARRRRQAAPARLPGGLPAPPGHGRSRSRAISVTGDLTRKHVLLRAYDAVHLATALVLREVAPGACEEQPGGGRIIPATGRRAAGRHDDLRCPPREGRRRRRPRPPRATLPRRAVTAARLLPHGVAPSAAGGPPLPRLPRQRRPICATSILTLLVAL